MIRRNPDNSSPTAIDVEHIDLESFIYFGLGHAAVDGSEHADQSLEASIPIHEEN